MNTNGDSARRRDMKVTLLCAVGEARSAAKRLTATAAEMGRSEDYQRGVADATEAMVDAMATYITDRA